MSSVGLDLQRVGDFKSCGYISMRFMPDSIAPRR